VQNCSHRVAWIVEAQLNLRQGEARRYFGARQEAVIAILGADEFFDEGCLAGQVRR
jgi:hypothetical protein